MRFRKDPGRPGPVGAPAECFGAAAGPVDGRRSGPGDHLMAASAMFPLKCPSLPPSGRDSRGRRHRPREPPDGVRDRGGALRPPPCADAPARPAPGSRHRRRDPVREAAARQGAGDRPVFGGHHLIPVDGTGHSARNPSTATTAASPAAVTGRRAIPTACPPAWSAIPTAGRCRRRPRSRSPGPTGTGGTTACGGTASAPSPGGDPATTRRRSPAPPPAPTPARPGSPTPTAPCTTCATGRRAGQRLPSRHRGQRHRMPGDGHQEEMHREARPRPGRPDPPGRGETEGVPLGHRPSRGRRQPRAGHARRPLPLAHRERDPGTLGNQGQRSGTGFGHGKRRLNTVPAMTVMPAFPTARTGAASRRVFAAAPGRGGGRGTSGREPGNACTTCRSPTGGPSTPP